MESYPALKREEILTCATMWNLEDILLSEIRQSPKDGDCTILLIRGPQRSHIHRDKVGWWSWGLGEGDGELVFNGDRISILQNKESSGEGYTTM